MQPVAGMEPFVQPQLRHRLPAEPHVQRAGPRLRSLIRFRWPRGGRACCGRRHRRGGRHHLKHPAVRHIPPGCVRSDARLEGHLEPARLQHPDHSGRARLDAPGGLVADFPVGGSCAARCPRHRRGGDRAQGRAPVPRAPDPLRPRRALRRRVRHRGPGPGAVLGRGQGGAAAGALGAGVSHHHGRGRRGRHPRGRLRAQEPRARQGGGHGLGGPPLGVGTVHTFVKS
mmetsp:Transcript_19275/g.53465  ORF Transcript_19275/g.53465 Transcript_19275/m.53465 type:complete len:228 (+) Transcript_19275:427-1110(+)